MARYAGIMAQKFHFDRIGIAGTGRVARALALALRSTHGSQADIWGRSAENAEQVALLGGGTAVCTLEQLFARCDAIAIAVADDAIAPLVADAAAFPMAHGPFVFHLSGRSGAGLLEPLQRAGARTAAVHPAMTFTGDPGAEVVRMTGARFAVTSPDPQAMADANALVAALGGIAVEIAEPYRPLYHAALCHGANHLVTLLSGAMGALSAAGVAQPAELLAPLVRAALENSLGSGFDALSGPVLRGDAGTVSGHLTALATHDPALLPAYRAMAAATLTELERRGASPGALGPLLNGPQPR